MKSETRVLGIFVKKRSLSITLIQDVLTKFGCSIRTRLGINISSQLNVPDAGLILLELIGDIKEMDKLEDALKDIHQVQVKKMVFKEL